MVAVVRVVILYIHHIGAMVLKVTSLKEVVLQTSS